MLQLIEGSVEKCSVIRLLSLKKIPIPGPRLIGKGTPGRKGITHAAFNGGHAVVKILDEQPAVRPHVISESADKPPRTVKLQYSVETGIIIGTYILGGGVQEACNISKVLQRLPVVPGQPTIEIGCSRPMPGSRTVFSKKIEVVKIIVEVVNKACINLEAL